MIATIDGCAQERRGEGDTPTAFTESLEAKSERNKHDWASQGAEIGQLICMPF